MVDITYLTKKEFSELGFDEVDNFDKLLLKAENSINLFIHNFYDNTEFESDFEPRKRAVKLATAFQVSYLDVSGITTADDKQAFASVSVGRTSVSYREGTEAPSEVSRYNLSLDAFNALTGAGFGYRGVNYDRY